VIPHPERAVARLACSNTKIHNISANELGVAMPCVLFDAKQTIVWVRTSEIELASAEEMLNVISPAMKELLVSWLALVEDQALDGPAFLMERPPNCAPFLVLSDSSFCAETALASSIQEPLRICKASEAMVKAEKDLFHSKQPIFNIVKNLSANCLEFGKLSMQQRALSRSLELISCFGLVSETERGASFGWPPGTAPVKCALMTLQLLDMIWTVAAEKDRSIYEALAGSAWKMFLETELMPPSLTMTSQTAAAAAAVAVDSLPPNHQPTDGYLLRRPVRQPEFTVPERLNAHTVWSLKSSFPRLKIVERQRDEPWFAPLMKDWAGACLHAVSASLQEVPEAVQLLEAFRRCRHVPDVPKTLLEWRFEADVMKVFNKFLKSVPLSGDWDEKDLDDMLRNAKTCMYLRNMCDLSLKTDLSSFNGLLRSLPFSLLAPGVSYIMDMAVKIGFDQIGDSRLKLVNVFEVRNSLWQQSVSKDPAFLWMWHRVRKSELLPLLCCGPMYLEQSSELFGPGLYFSDDLSERLGDAPPDEREFLLLASIDRNFAVFEDVDPLRPERVPQSTNSVLVVKGRFSCGIGPTNSASGNASIATVPSFTALASLARSQLFIVRDPKLVKFHSIYQFSTDGTVSKVGGYGESGDSAKRPASAPKPNPAKKGKPDAKVVEEPPAVKASSGKKTSTAVKPSAQDESKKPAPAAVKPSAQEEPKKPAAAAAAATPPVAKSGPSAPPAKESDKTGIKKAPPAKGNSKAAEAAKKLTEKPKSGVAEAKEAASKTVEKQVAKSKTTKEGEPAEEVAKKTAKKSVEKAAEEPAKKIAKVVEKDEKDAEKPVEKKPAGKPLAKRGAVNPAKKPVECNVEKPVEKVAEKPAEKVDSKPVEKAVEKPAEKVDSKPVEKAVEKPAEKVDSKLVEKAVEKPAEKVDSKLVEKAVEKPAEKVDSKPVEKTVEKPAEKVESKPVEKVAEKPAEKVDSKPVEKSSEAIVDEKLVEKPVVEPVVKPAEKVVEKPVEKIAAEKIETPAEKHPVEEPKAITAGKPKSPLEAIAENPQVGKDVEVENDVSNNLIGENVIEAPLKKRIVAESSVEKPAEKLVEKKPVEKPVAEKPLRRSVDVEKPGAEPLAKKSKQVAPVTRPREMDALTQKLVQVSSTPVMVQEASSIPAVSIPQPVHEKLKPPKKVQEQAPNRPLFQGRAQERRPAPPPQPVLRESVADVAKAINLMKTGAAAAASRVAPSPVLPHPSQPSSSAVRKSQSPVEEEVDYGPLLDNKEHMFSTLNEDVIAALNTSQFRQESETSPSARRVSPPARIDHSPVRQVSPRADRSPVRQGSNRRSPVAIRKRSRSRSPVRQGSPVRSDRRSPLAVRKQSRSPASPVRSDRRSPVAIRKRSRSRGRSRSPHRKDGRDSSRTRRSRSANRSSPPPPPSRRLSNVQSSPKRRSPAKKAESDLWNPEVDDKEEKKKKKKKKKKSKKEKKRSKLQEAAEKVGAKE
jgi:hypothetical protein